jgi:hypothetical protein
MSTDEELLARLDRHLHRASSDGEMHLVIVLGDGGWMVGSEWGREAEDSPMVAAAAYGTGHTLTEAMEQMLGEAGEP